MVTLCNMQCSIQGVLEPYYTDLLMSLIFQCCTITGIWKVGFLELVLLVKQQARFKIKSCFLVFRVTFLDQYYSNLFLDVQQALKHEPI